MDVWWIYLYLIIFGWCLKCNVGIHILYMDGMGIMSYITFIPGSSKCVQFLPFGRFFFCEKAQMFHSWKIQVWYTGRVRTTPSQLRPFAPYLVGKMAIFGLRTCRSMTLLWLAVVAGRQSTTTKKSVHKKWHLKWKPWQLFTTRASCCFCCHHCKRVVIPHEKINSAKIDQSWNSFLQPFENSVTLCMTQIVQRMLLSFENAIFIKWFRTGNSVPID